MSNIESTVLQVVDKLEELASQNDSLWFNQQVLNQVNVLRQALAGMYQEHKQDIPRNGLHFREMYFQDGEPTIHREPPPHTTLGINSDKQASEFIEKILWEVIDVLAMFPRAKTDPQTWEHLMVYAPQREPLTDEQIEDLYFDKFSMGELKAFARAIEAAHGIGEQV